MPYPQYIRNAQNALTYYSLIFIQWVIIFTPKAIFYPFINGMISIAFRFLKRLRAISMKNLKAAYGNQKTEQELEGITKATLKNIARSMIDLLYYVDRPEKFSKLVDLEGKEHLEKVIEKNKGVICMTAHMGNFSLMFVALVQMGYKVNVIIRPMRSKSFEKFMVSQINKWGIKFVRTYPQKEFFKDSIKALKNNELLFILMDEGLGDENGVDIDFFGRHIPISTGPILFHERTGAPILPMFIVKEGERFKIIICPELEIKGEVEKSKQVQATMSSLVECIEEMVKKYPVQWGGWLNKRWIQDEHNKVLDKR